MGKKFILVHGFRSFGAWSLSLISVDLRQGRTSWQGVHGRAKLLTSWQPESKEKARGKGQRQNVPFKNTMTYFLQQSSIS
jgi:hypothetical protein